MAIQHLTSEGLLVEIQIARLLAFLPLFKQFVCLFADLFAVNSLARNCRIDKTLKLLFGIWLVVMVIALGQHVRLQLLLALVESVLLVDLVIWLDKATLHTPVGRGAKRCLAVRAVTPNWLVVYVAAPKNRALQVLVLSVL